MEHTVKSLIKEFWFFQNVLAKPEIQISNGPYYKLLHALNKKQFLKSFKILLNRHCNITNPLNKTAIVTPFQDVHYNFGCKNYVPYIFGVINFALKGFNNYGTISRSFSFDHFTIGKRFEFSVTNQQNLFFYLQSFPVSSGSRNLDLQQSQLLFKNRFSIYLSKAKSNLPTLYVCQ